MDPLVSVITPAYNCEDFLLQTIESVRNQSFTNWEHIIVDDHSTDNTRLVIDKAATEDSRIVPIYLGKNGGVANARNMGIKAARGKYIAFLDSDDLWMPHKLAKHMEYMEKHDCDFTYSNYQMIDYEGRFIKNVVYRKKRINYRQLLYSNQIGCLTAVIKSEIIKKTLMPNIKHEDYATWLTILKQYVKHAERLDDILASYRISNRSVSSNKLGTVPWTWNIYRRNQNLSFFDALRHIIIFETLATIKHLIR